MEVLKSKKPKSFDFGFLHALKGGLAEEEGVILVSQRPRY
jgi:hypothetical protein